MGKYAFTISGIDSTSITIAAPDDSVTYSDATENLFGGVPDAGVLTIVGSFPQACTVETTLTAESLRVNKVLWDNWELAQAERSAFIDVESTGTPSYYNVRGNKIRLFPVPTEQKKWYIEYKGVPSKVTTPLTTTEIPDIPAKYQRALSYWVAKELLLSDFEDDLANRRYGDYKRIVNQYKIDYANNSPKIGPSRALNNWYTVV